MFAFLLIILSDHCYYYLFRWALLRVLRRLFAIWGVSTGQHSIIIILNKQHKLSINQNHDFLPKLHHRFCLFSTAFHSAWDHICWFFDVWMNDNRGGKVAGRKKHANSTQSKGEDEGGGEAAPCLPACLPAFLPSLLLPEMFPIPSFHSIQVTVGIWQHSGIRNCHGIASLPIPPQLHQREGCG